MNRRIWTKFEMLQHFDNFKVSFEQFKVNDFVQKYDTF